MRVFVVGLGQRGLQWLDMLARCADLGFETVAGIDMDPARRSEARRFLGGARRRLYPTLELALRDQRAEMSIVCTPDFTHEVVVGQCLDAEMAVLVEKPIAATSIEAHRMIAAARHRRRPLLVAQNYRHSAPDLTIRKALADGVIGRPGFAHCTQQRYRPASMNYLGTRPYAQLDMAAHHFDSFRLYFGADIASVGARGFSPAWSDYPHGAAISASITLDNAIEISYFGSFVSQVNSFMLRIEGEDGILAYDGKKPRYQLRGHLRPRALPVPPDVHALDRLAPPLGGMRGLLVEMQRAVSGEKNASNRAESNLNTFGAILAAQQSDQKGRTVTVAEALGSTVS